MTVQPPGTQEPTPNSQNPSPNLSIVILNWNVADMLAACLRALPAACGPWWEHTEVLVVDNASTDDSVDMVRREFAGVRLLALGENLGFSGGNNAGIVASRGRLVLLLNPDTLPHPGSITTLANFMEVHPKVGIAGPRLLNSDGTLQPSRRRFPTLLTALVESTPLQPFFKRSKVLERFYMLDRPDDQAQRVGWVSGAALMCRRETLQQSGMFDPGYFMFSEEVDLCRRASDAGWLVAYVPAAQVTHFGGQSTGQDVPSRHVHFNAGKARYFRLHASPLEGRLVRLYLLASYVAQSVSEGTKWLLGHKRPLRSERLKMYAHVLRTRLRESGRPRTPGAAHRVLLITGEYPPARGGVGDYTCRLNLSLGKAGITARVLAKAERGVWDADSAGSSQPNPPFVLRPSSFVLPLEVPQITLRSVLRALRGTGSDIAHIQYQTAAYDMRPTANLLPMLLGWLWGKPVVVTFHDLLVPYLFPKAGPVREWANRIMARSATACVVTNPDDADRLRAWGVSNVSLIPIGSNIPNKPPVGYSREEWRASRDVGTSTMLLAYFGFLSSTKGLYSLLEALAALKRDDTERRYRLLMVGGGLGSSDPTNRNTAREVERLAARLGLQDDLLWTGFLSPEEVSAALLSADIAVLPYADGASFRRGSLMAVLEHSLPLITTQPRREQPYLSGDWPQLVDGKNALLVPAGDAAALAEAISRLGADPALMAALAAGARYLASSFAWERIALMHRDLYERLLR